MHVSGKALLDSVLHLPLVLPPVVVGYLLLVSMGRRGLSVNVCMTGLVFSFAFSWRGAVLAPLSCLSADGAGDRLALEGVDIKLEQAAERWAPGAGVSSSLLPYR